MAGASVVTDDHNRHIPLCNLCEVSFLLQWLAEHIPISLFETSTVCNAFNYRSIILTSINETLTLSNWLLCKLRFVSSCINIGFWIILSSHQPIISISRWRAHVQLQPHCTSDPLLLAFTSQDNLCSHDQIYSKPPTPRGSWEILQGLLRVTPAASPSACCLSVRAASAIHLQIGPRIPTALLILFPQHKCLNGKTDQILRRCSDIRVSLLCVEPPSFTTDHQ